MNTKFNPTLMKRFFVLPLLFVFMACSNDAGAPTPDEDATNEDSVTEEPVTEANARPNIMLIIADDMGLDATPGYAIGAVKPNMPNLQQMIDSGIRFNNLWSYSTCTPTRASILTGKFGFRTNVTRVGDELSTAETSLQQYIDDNTSSAYDKALIGKWHLSSDANQPNTMGVDYYGGILSGAVQDYSDWTFVENGTTSTNTEYTTTKFADLAIDWLNDRTKPWFLWLAFNAPHTPFHLPDTSLHSQGNLPTDEASIEDNPLPYYMAMIEAMDTEMGRVIQSMDEAQRENTIFIFIGDNGSPNQTVQEYNSRRAKGSIYQGGINVPMIISGTGVTRLGDNEDALVNTTDLFATIAELAGASVNEINDSKSFKALLTNPDAESRDYVFAENTNRNTGGFDYSIRNATHKYIRFDQGTEALYNISDSFIENPNLLSENQQPLSAENEAILNELTSELDKIIQQN